MNIDRPASNKTKEPCSNKGMWAHSRTQLIRTLLMDIGANSTSFSLLGHQEKEEGKKGE
jgi:hypothetical protein